MVKGYLREATMEDRDLLFEWANDSFVRQNSFSTGKITYEEHKEWFSRLLENPDCRQYIYMYDNEAVGQVRITVHQIIAEISYSICKEKRHQGHGKAILKLISKQVGRDFPKVQKLVGKVKADNEASKNAFLHAGFGEKYSVYERQINI